MKKLAKVALANFLILLILLLCIEITLRVKGDTYTWTEHGKNTYVDPWSSNNSNDLHVRSQGRHIEQYPEFTYVIDVNEDGVRDIYHSKDNLDEAIRVLGLGDSFMEGMGAVFDSTIMALLKSELNKLYPEESYETFSGGVAGSDIFRSFNLFKEKFTPYSPDYLIILFNNTDVGDWLLNGNENNVKPNVPKPNWLERKLFKYSHLYRSITINILGYSWLQQSPNQQQKSWELFKKDFKQIVAKYINMMEGNKTKILFVFHPLVHEYNNNQYYYNYNELFDFLENQGVKYVDAMSCFKSRKIESDEIFWRLDMHFNSRGYALIAECIIESNFIIP